MPYPEFFVEPMRQELTALGVKELRTRDEVDAAVSGTPGTLMIVVNSVCGCAAGRARPAIALALRHQVRPDLIASVFAGFDVDATDRARGYFTGYPPSSPSIGLLQNGSLVYMLERRQIEGRDAEAIAADLTRAFDRFCGAGASTDAAETVADATPRGRADPGRGTIPLVPR
jgi:putative YphP/YqiW family bacilliredoxin